MALIDMEPWKTISVYVDHRPKLTIYTDAACDSVQGTMSVRLCYVILSANYCSAGRAAFSPDVFSSLSARETFIAQGEAFAPLLALFHESRALADSSAIWWIDNMGILSCFCKGSSVVGDVSCIIHAAVLRMASIRMRSWYEHVDSHANVADGGTRFSTTITDLLGIPMRDVSLPPWPKDTLHAPPSEWLSWFQVS